MTTRLEMGAALDHACLHSRQPEALAAFLEKAYALQRFAIGGAWHCTGPERVFVVREGPPNSVGCFGFAFPSREALEAHRDWLPPAEPNPSPLFDDTAFGFTDPDGNRIAFGLGEQAPSNERLPARLQHIAFRTPRIDEMVPFYESIGFVVSDRVKDDEGVLRACFLRADAEHHALALFRADEARFDHLSCETRDVRAVVAWADRMASIGIPIHWGIGRHGPGNDVFFMVKDPEGNLFEISAEIEVCDADRPAGTWRHEQRTLNLWGTAILRS